jgi:hypothetical protein
LKICEPIHPYAEGKTEERVNIEPAEDIGTPNLLEKSVKVAEAKRD